MTPLFPNPRYEQKFVVHARSLAEAMATVRRHRAVFREVYPPRAVNNIYLDSPGLRAYFDHVNGTANRVKTRIRWYGQMSGPVERPVLERKLKRGLVSGKIAYALPALSINGGVPREELETTLLQAGLPEALQSTLRHLQPSLVNRYQRHYFLSADRRFRLTVDSQLQFFGAGNANGWKTPLFPRDIAIIIELKFDPCHAEYAPVITSTLPFRLARCSKYVLGIEGVTTA
jgi:SPX domain protein involved in polyphosphate accumulation